jgi:hypothetical protein
MADGAKAKFDWGRYSVLVVGDDKSIRDVLRELLENVVPA